MESTTISLTQPGLWPAHTAAASHTAALRRERVALYFAASPLQ